MQNIFFPLNFKSVCAETKTFETELAASMSRLAILQFENDVDSKPFVHNTRISFIKLIQFAFKQNVNGERQDW